MNIDKLIYLLGIFVAILVIFTGQVGFRGYVQGGGLARFLGCVLLVIFSSAFYRNHVDS